MCEKAVRKCLLALIDVWKSCNDYPSTLEFVFDWHKTQKKCEKNIDAYSFVLDTVADWFVIPKMLEVLDNVKDLDKLIIWHNKYKQHKTYDDELMSIAWE